MKFFRNFALSLTGIFLLLLASEFYLRFRMANKICNERKDCYTKKIFALRYLDIKSDPFFELLEFDKELGFVTKKNFEKYISSNKTTKPIKITLDSLGHRKSFSGNKSNFKRKRILTVGGDITFGTNVSDDNTWQYCLNKKQNKFVFENAGVPHYGLAQSVLRLKKLNNLDLYEAIIVSSDIWHDLRIDTHDYHFGYPVPRLIKKEDNLASDNQKVINLPGSRFSKREPSTFLMFAANSEILHRIFIKIGNKKNDPRHIVNRSISFVDNQYFTKNEILKWVIKETNSLDIPIYWVFSGRVNNRISNSNLISRRSVLIDIFSEEEVAYTDIVDNDLFSLYKNKKQINDAERPFDNSIICQSILNSKFFNKLN